MKRALLTGATGQDGSYLAELLLNKGYEVYGLVRRLSTPNFANIAPIADRIHLLDGDLMDQSSLTAAVQAAEPDEVYNLAAQSFVGTSFVQPVLTGEITGLGVLRLLEAVKSAAPHARVYQASCYDDQTRVLTTEGLKTHTQVKTGDVVFTVNVETNELETKPVRRVIVSHYRGEMVKIRGRRVDLLVTPNHRLLLQGTRGLFYALADNLATTTREPFYPRRSSIKLPNPEWRGTRNPTARLSEISPCAVPPHATKNLLEEIETNDLFWLTGLYIGDGYFSPDKSATRSAPKHVFTATRDSHGHFVSHPKKEPVRYPSHNVYFAIPSGDKSRRKLMSWLEKYDVDYRFSGDWVRFSSYTLGHFLRTCGMSSGEKHIPDWMLAYDREHLRPLFEGLIGSDGHAKPNGKSYAYVTTSQRLVPQVVELAVKLGLRSSTSMKPTKDVFFPEENRVIRSRRDAYSIHISDNHDRRPLTLYPTQVSRTPYEGTVWCLEVADNHNFLVERNGKYAFSGNSSEMFGHVDREPQDETTPFHPRSPYGVAKVYGYWACINYREAHDIYISNGILFNHESPRRGLEFVTRKIAHGVAAIAAKRTRTISLGNLDAKRDWGYAPEFVDLMWRVLQYKEPTEFVGATGEAHSVREFVEEAFRVVGIDDWERHVVTDERYVRPSEVYNLRGDASKAKRLLGWEAKTRFKGLVKIMVEAELAAAGLPPR